MTLSFDLWNESSYGWSVSWVVVLNWNGMRWELWQRSTSCTEILLWDESWDIISPFSAWIRECVHSFFLLELEVLSFGLLVQSWARKDSAIYKCSAWLSLKIWRRQSWCWCDFLPLNGGSSVDFLQSGYSISRKWRGPLHSLCSSLISGTSCMRLLKLLSDRVDAVELRSCNKVLSRQASRCISGQPSRTWQGPLGRSSFEQLLSNIGMRIALNVTHLLDIFSMSFRLSSSSLFSDR